MLQNDNVIIQWFYKSTCRGRCFDRHALAIANWPLSVRLLCCDRVVSAKGFNSMLNAVVIAKWAMRLSPPCCDRRSVAIFVLMRSLFCCVWSLYYHRPAAFLAESMTAVLRSQCGQWGLHPCHSTEMRLRLLCSCWRTAGLRSQYCWTLRGCWVLPWADI